MSDRTQLDLSDDERELPRSQPQVYVAGGFQFKEDIRLVQRCLESEAGHRVSWDWTSVEKGPAESVGADEWARYSQLDLDGVRNADYVVAVFGSIAQPRAALSYAYSGTFCELGCALGLGKPVIVLDLMAPNAKLGMVPKYRLCPFYHDPAIAARVDVIADAIESARRIAVQRGFRPVSGGGRPQSSTPPSDDGLPMPPTTPRVD